MHNNHNVQGHRHALAHKMLMTTTAMISWTSRIDALSSRNNVSIQMSQPMQAGREHSRKRPPLLVLLFNCHAKIPAVRIQTRSFLTDISWTNSYFHAFDQLPLFILQHDKIVVKYPHGPTVRCAPSIFNSVVDLLTMTQCARVSNMNFGGLLQIRAEKLWNGESFHTPILSVSLAFWPHFWMFDY